MCAKALLVAASLEDGVTSASEVGNVEPFAWLLEEKREEIDLLRVMVSGDLDELGTGCKFEFEPNSACPSIKFVLVLYGIRCRRSRAGVSTSSLRMEAEASAHGVAQ